jgi:hypothetical protein
MKDPVDNDNKYPRGTFIYAKVNPQLKLVIADYKQRIYFCAAVEHPEMRQFAYFERELIDPRGGA